MEGKYGHNGPNPRRSIVLSVMVLPRTVVVHKVTGQGMQEAVRCKAAVGGERCEIAMPQAALVAAARSGQIAQVHKEMLHRPDNHRVGRPPGGYDTRIAHRMPFGMWAERGEVVVGRQSRYSHERLLRPTRGRVMCKK